MLALKILGSVALAVWILLGIGAACRYRSRGPICDPYPPEAAEAPTDPIEHAYATVGDTFGFGVKVPVVLGESDGPLFAAEVEAMVRRAGEGADVYREAPKEMP